MNSISLSPFIAGRPVVGNEFLNRDKELGTIFRRLQNGESTAVVGEPHIGKSSVLMQIANKEASRKYLGGNADSLIFSYLDLHPIKKDYSPRDFWDEALDVIREDLKEETTSQLLEQASQAGYERGTVDKLLNHLARCKLCLVLLLDEFEVLLDHPGFQDGTFFAYLRKLANQNKRLAVVFASRFSIANLNRRWKKGSPFFNHMLEINLRPFDDRTIGIMLDRAKNHISTENRLFIRRMAGRHPFLLQAISASFLATKNNDRQSRAAEAFYDQVSFHFDDLWEAMDDRTRTTAIILSLIEFGKRALGQSFACGEIENVAKFGPELRRLAKIGLAEQVGKGWQFDLENSILWRGERWAIGSQAFSWWARDVVIANTRTVPTYDAWLAQKNYKLLLTTQQWDWLTKTLGNAPEWALRGVGGLARAVFDEMLRKK